MIVKFSDGTELSIVGPGDGWENQPQTAAFAKIFDMFAKSLGLPTTETRSDGKTNWEVASRRSDDKRPVGIPEWMEYRLPEPICDVNWEIYGHVPTEKIAGLMEARGCDPTEFLKWANAGSVAEAEDDRRP
jgi:hypothetical protein